MTTNKINIQQSIIQLTKSRDYLNAAISYLQDVINNPTDEPYAPIPDFPNPPLPPDFNPPWYNPQKNTVVSGRPID